MERWRIQHKESDYTMIDNGIFRDKDLSLAERGFLCTILSLPENWDFSVKGIVGVLVDGRDATYAVINRLIEHGYCKRTRNVDEKTGRFVGYDYTFFEVKNGVRCVSAPFTEIPYTESPYPGSPYTENPTQLNTKGINKVKNKVNKDSGVFTPPTLEEVKAYVEEKSLIVDPLKFWLYYEDCDWRLSGGKGARIKEWRRAALRWHLNDKEKNNGKKN